MLGYAWQRGLIPIGHAALMQAIEMNGTAVEANKAAFRWGRCMAVDAGAVARIAGLDLAVPTPKTLEALIDERQTELGRYQNRAYGARYRSLVERVRACEAQVAPGSTVLTEAVANHYYKLLAYKDEYEVARLYAGTAFRDALAAQFEGDVKLEFHMAPPLLARRDPVTGHLKKRSFGPWMMPVLRVMARLKFLRGTRLDVFDSSLERQLISDYEALITELLASVGGDTLGLAVALASLPEKIAGYGHVKERAVRLAGQERTRLLERFRGGGRLQAA